MRRIVTLATVVAIAVAAVLFPSHPAAQAPPCPATACLVAAPVSKVLALPNGSTATVPMWGFALDANGNGELDSGEVPTVPGPRIVVPAGTRMVTIQVSNRLPETPGTPDGGNISLVIPGQQLPGPPEGGAGHITSMSPTVAPGSTRTYTFDGFKPGTFLYHSGTHPAVQVQMGLYGAVTQDAAPAATGGTAYAGVTYATDVVLLFSEIDPALHQAVADGTYGTDPGPRSTIDYDPSLFLINGESFTGASAGINAGAAGQRTLVRLLNAGLASHSVVVDNATLTIVAEDGNPYQDARVQATILLPAGKTHDALWTPIAGGEYTVYDRMLRLEALTQPQGGMLAHLHVDSAGGAGTSNVTAAPDSYALNEDTTLNGSSVLANDAGALTAELVTAPQAGSLTLDESGTFTYTPIPNFSGADAFWYRAVNGPDRSEAVPVTITVGPVPDAPTAFPLSLGLTAGASKPVTLTGVDADGDVIKYYVSQLPGAAHGVLKVGSHTLVAQDLFGAAATRLAIPAGTLTYVADPAGDGQGDFQFVAFDGALASAPTTVAVTIHPLQTTAVTGTPITLAVKGVDPRNPGAVTTISNYRWTLEEDQTYQVDPGTLDPGTLAVSFHKSYMPVVASGDESTQPRVESGKRYFVSVLPTVPGFSNGGAPVDGSGTITVFVDKNPLPTAQIRVRVFEDNSPLNNQFDTDERPLVGFAVGLDDAGGRYGISGGQIFQDAFGNPLGTTYQPCTNPAGCDSYEAAQIGNGFLLTDADGFVTFQNLRPGKYTAKVIPPAGQGWQQTTTIEGQKGQDAWVKTNEPSYFTEFGPAGPHVEIGFTKAFNRLNGSGTSISGRVTNLHQSRPPDFTMFSGAPFDFTRAWVALNDGTAGNALWVQPTNPDGTFEITKVPAGTYTLAIFDSALDIIFAEKSVTVSNSAVMLGDIPVFSWFHRLYHFVFEDTNKNGIRDAGEAGIREVPLNTRWRDGSIFQSSATDGSGFLPFEETFPFFAWQIAEVDYGRFRATGVTTLADNGGPLSDLSWSTDVQAVNDGGSVDARVLVPQPQTAKPTWGDNEAPSFGGRARTETGPALLEGFQGYVGQTNAFLWGKAAYDSPGSHGVDADVAPFDDFPGPGDHDWNGNGKFDLDEFNGGITGIVHYSTTRAENNARWGTPEPWEPGIPRVTVQLWDESRTHVLNEGQTDSWDDNLPTGCQGAVFTYLSNTTDCYDGMRNWNQIRPAVFDGGYAFYTIKQDTFDANNPTAPPTFALPLDQRTAERPLPAGRYVVKVILPNGYTLVKEEDKNVDFGDEFVPQQFFLAGYPLAEAAGPADPPPPKEGAVEDPIYAPFCVGDLHTVPTELALFPGVNAAYGGDQMPLCDEKLVTVRHGTNGAANFFLFTPAPIAGHIIGFVLDDMSAEFDANSPQFGEKYAPPWLPVSIRDWTGREISHTYTDRYGVYNAMVPSTYTASTAIPSGMTPSMLSACINSPLMTGAGGTLVPDPHYNKQYSQFCYTLQYMPGTTTYLDTPVIPTGAFAGPGQATLDAELPDKTPVIYSVTQGTDPQGGIGPYIVDDAAQAVRRTITIKAAGPTRVTNPAFDANQPDGGNNPKSITRDYGFGSATGQVFVGTTQIPSGNLTWTDAQITAVVPTGTPTGQLRVVRCLTADCASTRSTVMGVTLSVATPTWDTANPPRIVGVGGSIQRAIDAAAAGDLILVHPGTYEELVVMDKPVRLQGWGAPSTTINAVKNPAEKIQAWRDRVYATLNGTPDYMLPFQVTELATGFDQAGELLGPVLGGEGAAVTVLGRGLPVLGATCPQTRRPLTPQAYGLQAESGNLSNLRSKARIDGFGITGSDQAAGIEVNANACNLEILNNRIFSNTGDFGSGVRIGHPGAVTDLADADAHNDFVVVANNHVLQNTSLNYDAGGGIAIGTGARSYAVRSNFVAGNFTMGNGAGVAHIGLSDGGTIDKNTIVFNEGFNQELLKAGGGLYIGGRLPAANDLTPGAGKVTVSNNLILGNASVGDGGGIALAYVDGQGAASTASAKRCEDQNAADPHRGYCIDLFGNTIANNVAGLAGGGVALQDALNVRIFHNTVVANDSLATAGAAFPSGPNRSTPQPAGIVARGNSLQLGTIGAVSYSNPKIRNSIVWQNRSFYFGPCSEGGTAPCTQNMGNPPVGLPSYHLIPTPANTGALHPVEGMWDFGLLGATGTFDMSASVHTAAADGTAGTTNSTTAPPFVATYFNGDRRQSIQAPDINSSIPVSAIFDEGGNFVRAMFGPLTLTRQTNGQPYGNYHLTGTGEQGLRLHGSQLGLTPQLYGVNSDTVPPALAADTDGDSRVANASFPQKGADQWAPIPPPSVSIGDASIAEGNSGTTVMNFTVTLSRAFTSAVSLVYATANGSGASGAIGGAAACTPGLNVCDYVTVGANTPVVINPGQTTATVNVTVKGDTIYEPDQTFVVNLALAAGETDATLGDGQAVGTIANDDAIPTLSIADATATEPTGIVNLATGPMTFTVTLTGAHEQTSSVPYYPANGTAVGQLLLPGPNVDFIYPLASPTVSFAPSTAASQTATATVTIVRNGSGDPAGSGTETYLVNLGVGALLGVPFPVSPTNAVIGDGQAVGTIINRP